jgi:hypothetical protein
LLLNLSTFICCSDSGGKIPDADSPHALVVEEIG